MEGRTRLRELPSVDRLAAAIVDETSPATATSVARAVLAERRRELLAGATDEVDLIDRLRARCAPSLRRVLNATGVLIHTNLGRAPLSAAAVLALTETARGYSNLEFELDSGRRGERAQHVRELLQELTGAQDALVVNNGAAAVLLAVAAVASTERPVIVSRGQLVEIGGGFRIPEVVAQAGAPLIEIGTTNRTRLRDYTAALAKSPDAVLLRVHQSNFRTVGFVEDVGIDSLCALGAVVIDDIGSGALSREVIAFAEEPSASRSVAAGASLVCFSADKLLGGPQAGILVGESGAVAACAQHPLARALRVGRLPLAALAATLALYRDPARAAREIPVLAMLTIDQESLRERADRLAQATGGTVIESSAQVGGGALPLLELTGPVVRLEPSEGNPLALAARLRLGDPPLIPRVADGGVLLDPRTLAEDELEPAAGVVRAAMRDDRTGS